MHMHSELGAWVLWRNVVPRVCDWNISRFLRKSPRASEVATIYWVFSKV